MFGRLTGHHEDEDRKDIFAPVADLMVGVVFIFIILMIALSLNLQSEDRVPKADYDAKVAEIQVLRKQLDATHKQLEAAEQKAARLAADNARLVEFARFVRDRSIVPLMDRLSRTDQTRTEILSDMRRRLNEVGVDVTVNAEAGTIGLPSRNLFASGRSDPTPEGRDTIFKLGSVMADVLPCYIAESRKGSGCMARGELSRLSAVYVEGHTDIVPYGTPSGRFRNNWDLSAGRAIEAYTILRTQSETIRDLRNSEGQALVGVSGYADTRPADPTATDRTTVQVMDKDRRIEVRLLMTADAEIVGSVLRELNQELESVRELVR